MLLEDHIPKGTGTLRDLILAIADLSMDIRDGFMTNQGVAGTRNIYGDTQVEMDKWADEVLVDGLSRLPMVASVASEERDEIIEVDPDGEFSVVFDPLDGSSLMGVDLTVGTIVGIFRSPTPLRPGKELAGAMYILYGPLTVLVYTVGKGVHEFVQNTDDEYVLQKEDLRIGTGKIYSPGGLRKEYLPAHRRFIERLEDEGYKLRFAGAFVADVHQIIHKGGVFTYPATIKNRTGKLRLLFEADPMGFIVTEAGGAISDGHKDILGIDPDRIDLRVPIYIGGQREIQMIQDENRGK
ncbi:MAG: fructose-1,6-bisphosphatase [Candidatus Thermoplasmatota archaeon]|nr:fructose-1,6-bisphosphatase [Candidatus Thermoplasmatota archaeon]